jgi:limonene 1,2-monooxygenase
MHLAETREQARADMEHGTLRLARYQERLGGGLPPYAHSTDAMLDQWTGDGLVIFGKLTLGTPDDMIAEIARIEKQSGGFGSVLLLAHNCANPEATRKSYELFARYVMPAVNGMNRGRGDSLDWAHDNSSKFIGAMLGGISKAIEDHQTERSERGEGVVWGDQSPPKAE